MSFALITGASSGIGLELAKLMAQKGHNLFLVARSGNILQTLKAEWEKQYVIKVEFLALDLSVDGATRELHQHCKTHGITVDYLVNNAGFGDYGAVDASKLDTYENMLRLNIMALTALTSLFVTDMRQRGRGRILNIGSLLAFMSVPNMAVYAATKAYVMHFTEALNHELRGTGVTATALNPGLTETGFVGTAGMGTARVLQLGAMSANTVAKVGYDAMMAGRLNAVPGWKNRLSAFASTTTPSREILLRIAASIFKERPITA